MRKHPIREVVLNVLEYELEIGDGWETGWDGNMRDVPRARYEEDCTVSLVHHIHRYRR